MPKSNSSRQRKGKSTLAYSRRQYAFIRMESDLLSITEDDLIDETPIMLNGRFNPVLEASYA